MPRNQHPHIIFIMTDQQRADTIGAWGHRHMETPTMDRLAAEGVSFRQAYCPGATCVSSRAALFTGMYPHNTGVYSFNPWAAHRNWVEDLAEAGYWCAYVGKMHFIPRDVPGGFHERIIVENPTNKTLANGGGDDDWGRFLSHHGLERPNERNRTDLDWKQKRQGVPWHLEERFHSDVFIGDSAVSWIHSHRGERPLFLQVGFTGPHEPWDPLPRHLELYRDREMPPRVMRAGELKGKPPQHAAHRRMHAETQHESVIDLDGATEAEIAEMRRHYYAKITTVDEQVGRVLAALEERGWLDDSILFLLSDHGELLGDLVSLMDVGPTVLEAAGLAVPAYMEGRSLMGYLEGNAPEPREFVFCEDNYLVMMRSQSHKIVYYMGQEAGELYDLERDPHELENLWAESGAAALKGEMLNKLLEWLAASTYYNAGYRRDRSRSYAMRWPSLDDPYLHGARSQGGPRQVDVL